MNADNKTQLEDIYLPYKPKRRTKAQIAREAGLQVLADQLLENPTLDPDDQAKSFISADKGFADTKSVLDGARQILMETWSEDAVLSGELREWLWEHARLNSTLVEGKKSEGEKFSDYFDFSEEIRKIPSHRALALFRGRNEGIIRLELQLSDDEKWLPLNRLIIRFHLQDQGRAADAWLLESARLTWRIKFLLRLELELKSRLFDRAQEEAIQVFANNLNDLLLTAPAGQRPTLGLDPGLRTGVKVAVIDGTGQVVDTETIYPHPPRRQWDRSIFTLAKLAEKHRIELIAIGNGTASRETDRLASELIKRHPELHLHKLVVSEAGASIYSASPLASAELPELDVSLRGAVSIARRLQDPLAELVKIDPKSIGVGQYQHDVSQLQLAHSLDNVVEDCVNAVGVDLNTASPALLSRVSGLTPSLAENVVQFRNQYGAFRNRQELLKVPRLGAKTYEQAAGFLRIRNGTNPLDSSAVHPEAYPVVERILEQTERDIKQVIGDSAFIRKLNASDFIDDRFGAPTVRDIFSEMEKPGRDPRPEFQTASFKEGVETLKDLSSGMVLEGVVTNITNFGAFVDIGVHQDGLVHISAMSHQFIKDPRQCVKTGEVVRVKVMEVDVNRKRIALSMRLDDSVEGTASNKKSSPSNHPRTHISGKRKNREKEQENRSHQGTMAAAFASLKGLKTS